MPLPARPLSNATEPVEPPKRNKGGSTRSHVPKPVEAISEQVEEVSEEFDFLQDEEETITPQAQQEYEENDFDDENNSETEYEESDDYDDYQEFNDKVRGFTPEVMESVELLISAITSDESSEVLMNSPSEIMIKKNGERHQIPNIDFGDGETYHRVINEFVLCYADTEERIHNKSYLVEGQLEINVSENEPPMLARIHIVAPPVIEYAKVTIAKKSRYQYSINDIVERGSMTENMGEFLKAIARGRLVTIISGISGAGKTTMLEAMSHEFDGHDRVIVIEDTPELRIPVADVVTMTSTSTKPGMKVSETITLEWLVRLTNRMRPDRIIVGEVRGAEMAEFLIAANSGADGSMTTVHAANPRMTLEKMKSLAMKAEGAKNENSVARDIARTVQIVVQASLIDGKHITTHIEEISDTVTNSGAIATTTIFEYDRMSQTHIARGRPSEQLVAFLAGRGVRVDNAWFRKPLN